MNAAVQIRFARAERLALVGAALALALAAIFAWLTPQAFAPAYRFAVFAWLELPLGSLFFLLIYKITGGQWGDSLQPFFAAGLRLLPWAWLLAFPLLFFAAPGRAMPASPWYDYSSHAMMMARACFYALAFFILKKFLPRASRWGSLRWFAPAGLIGLVFMLHLLADDWLAALEPHWYSTGFALVWMTGQAVAGLAGATLAAILFGLNPNADAGAGRAIGLDWGNLLLTAAMLWCYVGFAQLLIIWSGNLPSEISWYVRRSQGGWLAVAATLGVVHFILPLLILLSRPAKRSACALGSMAGLLLGAQWLYIAWVILPAFSLGRTRAWALVLALFAALGGIFLNRFFAGARRQLARLEAT